MNQSPIIDISRPIHPGMAIYPNNPGVEFASVQEVGEGKNALSSVTLGTHTGTHIDAPSHVFAGQSGALSYGLDVLVGPCQVVELADGEDVVTAAHVEQVTSERVLFKTRNSKVGVDDFDDAFVALDDSAAEACVHRNMQLVGVDALSIRRRGTKNQVHETLIEAGIVILEGVWLADVTPGQYELTCLPLKWDLDGAPARAILRLIGSTLEQK